MRGAATAAAIVALTLATLEAEQSVFRSRTDVVVIDAAVKDGGRTVSSLSRDDVVLRDNGVVQTILDFERERSPLDVTLAIDVSGSMVGSKRVAVEHAIAAIGAALEPADRVGVITFDTQVREIAPLAAPPMSAELKSGSGGTAVIDAIVTTTGGAILSEGTITEKSVTYTKEAFDIGTVTLGRDDNAVILHVMNEYMAVETAGGVRLATFPDVITTLSPEGEPLSVGQLEVGMRVFVLHVPKTVIPLASSVLDPTVYPPVEKAMGIELARYALGTAA